MTVHDLRVVRGTTHTNLVFDAGAAAGRGHHPGGGRPPHPGKGLGLDGDYYAVVTVEHSFTE